MIQVHRRKISATQSKNSHKEHLSPRGRTIRNHQQLRRCDRCLWRGEPRTSTVPLRVQRVDNGSILVSLSQVMIIIVIGTTSPSSLASTLPASSYRINARDDGRDGTSEGDAYSANRRKSGTCKFLGGCNKAISPVILAIITSPSMLRKVIGAGVVGGC